jgi:hypothetical protein
MDWIQDKRKKKYVMQGGIFIEDRHSRSSTRTQRHHYSLIHSTKNSHALEGSKSNPKVS